MNQISIMNVIFTAKTHYRYYDIKQNARFDMIQYMKELGMELKEIKEFDYETAKSSLMFPVDLR